MPLTKLERTLFKSLLPIAARLDGILALRIFLSKLSLPVYRESSKPTPPAYAEQILHALLGEPLHPDVGKLERGYDPKEALSTFYTPPQDPRSALDLLRACFRVPDAPQIASGVPSAGPSAGQHAATSPGPTSATSAAPHDRGQRLDSAMWLLRLLHERLDWARRAGVLSPLEATSGYASVRRAEAVVRQWRAQVESAQAGVDVPSRSTADDAAMPYWGAGFVGSQPDGKAVLARTVRQGTLLLSHPFLAPPFNRSVVLVLEHNAGGTVGVDLAGLGREPVGTGPVVGSGDRSDPPSEGSRWADSSSERRAGAVGGSDTLAAGNVMHTASGALGTVGSEPDGGFWPRQPELPEPDAASAVVAGPRGQSFTAADTSGTAVASSAWPPRVTVGGVDAFRHARHVYRQDVEPAGQADTASSSSATKPGAVAAVQRLLHELEGGGLSSRRKRRLVAQVASLRAGLSLQDKRQLGFPFRHGDEVRLEYAAPPPWALTAAMASQLREQGIELGVVGEDSTTADTAVPAVSADAPVTVLPTLPALGKGSSAPAAGHMAGTAPLEEDEEEWSPEDAAEADAELAAWYASAGGVAGLSEAESFYWKARARDMPVVMHRGPALGADLRPMDSSRYGARKRADAPASVDSTAAVSTKERRRRRRARPAVDGSPPAVAAVRAAGPETTAVAAQLPTKPTPLTGPASSSTAPTPVVAKFGRTEVDAGQLLAALRALQANLGHPRHAQHGSGEEAGAGGLGGDGGFGSTRWGGEGFGREPEDQDDDDQDGEYSDDDDDGPDAELVPLEGGRASHVEEEDWGGNRLVMALLVDIATGARTDPLTSSRVCAFKPLPLGPGLDMPAPPSIIKAQEAWDQAKWLAGQGRYLPDMSLVKQAGGPAMGGKMLTDDLPRVKDLPGQPPIQLPNRTARAQGAQPVSKPIITPIPSSVGFSDVVLHGRRLLGLGLGSTLEGRQTTFGHNRGHDEDDHSDDDDGAPSPGRPSMTAQQHLLLLLSLSNKGGMVDRLAGDVATVAVKARRELGDGRPITASLMRLRAMGPLLEFARSHLQGIAQQLGPDSPRGCKVTTALSILSEVREEVEGVVRELGQAAASGGAVGSMKDVAAGPLARLSSLQASFRRAILSAAAMDRSELAALQQGQDGQSDGTGADASGQAEDTSASASALSLLPEDTKEDGRQGQRTALAGTATGNHEDEEDGGDDADSSEDDEDDEDEDEAAAFHTVEPSSLSPGGSGLWRPGLPTSVGMHLPRPTTGLHAAAEHGDDDDDGVGHARGHTGYSTGLSRSEGFLHALVGRAGPLGLAYPGYRRSFGYSGPRTSDAAASTRRYERLQDDDDEEDGMGDVGYGRSRAHPSRLSSGHVDRVLGRTVRAGRDGTDADVQHEHGSQPGYSRLSHRLSARRERDMAGARGSSDGDGATTKVAGLATTTPAVGQGQRRAVRRPVEEGSDDDHDTDEDVLGRPDHHGALPPTSSSLRPVAMQMVRDAQALWSVYVTPLRGAQAYVAAKASGGSSAARPLVGTVNSDASDDDHDDEGDATTAHTDHTAAMLVAVPVDGQGHGSEPRQVSIHLLGDARRLQPHVARRLVRLNLREWAADVHQAVLAGQRQDKRAADHTPGQDDKEEKVPGRRGRSMKSRRLSSKSSTPTDREATAQLSPFVLAPWEEQGPGMAAGDNNTTSGASGGRPGQRGGNGKGGNGGSSSGASSSGTDHGHGHGPRGPSNSWPSSSSHPLGKAGSISPRVGPVRTPVDAAVVFKDSPVWGGGPVPYYRMLLHTQAEAGRIGITFPAWLGDRPWDGEKGPVPHEAMRPTTVWVARDATPAARLVKSGCARADDFSFFRGAAKWGRGQLAREVLEGSWLAVGHIDVAGLLGAARAAQAKDRDGVQPDLWSQVMRSLGGEYAAWSAQLSPGHAGERHKDVIAPRAATPAPAASTLTLAPLVVSSSGAGLFGVVRAPASSPSTVPMAKTTGSTAAMHKDPYAGRSWLDLAPDPRKTTW